MTLQPDLVAVRFPFQPDPRFDPFSLAGEHGIVFASEGRVLVGIGCATTLALPHGLEDLSGLDEVSRYLASIPCDDRVRRSESGTGPGPGGGSFGGFAGRAVVAFGALPFDRSAAASLTVPRVTVAIEPSGEAWVTVVSSASDQSTDVEEVRRWIRARSDEPVGRVAPSTSPVHIAPLSPGDSPESFEAVVDEALMAIHGGGLAKVVLARQMEMTAGDSIDIAGLLRRWHHLEPDCALFSMPGAGGQFVGASPELLVERSGLRVRSRPLAGTTNRSPDATEDPILPAELMASEKDGAEHRLVVEAIAERLGPLCSELEVPAGPHLVHLHNIVHLGTSLAGTLAHGPGRRVPSVLDLVGALHPTPAVGGVPTEAARSLIDRLEPLSRGRWAGPVGYLDAAGDGKWVLGIRSVSIRDRTARLAAGVGIVEGSDPRIELAETNLKFNAVFDALVPGFRLAMPAARRQPRAVS